MAKKYGIQSLVKSDAIIQKFLECESGAVPNSQPSLVGQGQGTPLLLVQGLAPVPHSIIKRGVKRADDIIRKAI